MLTIADSYPFLLYFLLCVLSMYSGMGILSLLKIDIHDKKILFLSPSIALVVVALLLNGFVQLGLPISSSYPFVGLVFITFGIYGFIQNNRHGIVKRQWLIENKWLMASWVLLPLLVMAGPYWYGSATKFGDILPDGWNYISFGQYLWKYPLGTEGGLSPLYQHASTLSNARFTSPAFLALFLGLFNLHDTSFVSGIYLGWLLFVFSGTCGFFIADKQFSGRTKILYVILVIFSGWIWNILWATNYDSLLALICAPVIVEIAVNKVYYIKRWAILLALIITSLTLMYVEFALLMLGILLIILFVNYFQAATCIRRKLIEFVITTGFVFILLLLPFSKWIYSFSSAQINAVSGDALKPGYGYLVGLLQPKCMPSAFWAMGCEQSLHHEWLYVGGKVITEDWIPAKNLLAWILSFLAFIGMVRLIQTKRWGEIVLPVILLIVVAYMAFIQDYPYGTYKIVVLLWWMVPYLCLVGVQLLENLIPFRFTSLSPLLLLPLLALLLLTAFRVTYVVVNKPAVNSSEYAQVREFLELNQGSPILADVDDWLSSEWAVYYLRDQDILLNKKRMYMAYTSDVVDRSKNLEMDDIRYVLSDGYPENFPLKERLWTGKTYSLWELPSDWLFVGDIQNRNGVENWEGKTSMWLGKEKAVISFLSSFDGMAVAIAQIGPGPHLSSGQPAAIKVWNDLGFQQELKIDSTGYYPFAIPVRKGKNKLFIKSLDDPAIKPSADSDSRVLLASVSDIQFSNELADEPVLIDVTNSKGVERIFGSSHYWIGNKPTRIMFYAPHGGLVELLGDFNPRSSAPKSRKWNLLVKSNSGFSDEIVMEENSGIIIPATQGINEITIQTLDKKKSRLIDLSNIELMYQMKTP